MEASVQYISASSTSEASLYLLQSAGLSAPLKSMDTSAGLKLPKQSALLHHITHSPAGQPSQTQRRASTLGTSSAAHLPPRHGGPPSPRLLAAKQRSHEPSPPLIQDPSSKRSLRDNHWSRLSLLRRSGRVARLHLPAQKPARCLSPGTHVLRRWTQSAGCCGEPRACSLHARCATNLYVYRSHLSTTSACLQPKTRTNARNGGEKNPGGKEGYTNAVTAITFRIHMAKSPFAAR